MKSILCLIPARGGSKGIPNKNITLLANKPLICYTIDAARYVVKDEDICVSTDADLVKQTVENYGLCVPFTRPLELAGDYSPTDMVITHALEYYKTIGKSYDFIVLLQPTSPLRNGAHIKEALALLTDKTEMIVSVKETKANPYYVLFEEDNIGMLQKSKTGAFVRRQDCPVVYELNGAIYIISVKKFNEHKSLSNLQKEKYVMEEKKSIDIDNALDLFLAECIIKYDKEHAR